MPDDARLTRGSFRKLSAVVVPLAMTQLPTRVWSDAEWNGIRAGYQAQSMDEKWNVFVEGRTAFLHRSWTGHGIFEASFARASGGGWSITSGIVESDPSRFRRLSPEHDRITLELVLSAIVLGQPVPKLRAELDAAVSAGPDVPPGLVQHSQIGLRS